MTNTEAIKTKLKDMHLVDSPDDGGYYWERYSDWAYSQVFTTINVALQAKKNNQIEWENDDDFAPDHPVEIDSIEHHSYQNCGCEDYPCCGH